MQTGFHEAADEPHAKSGTDRCCIEIVAAAIVGDDKCGKSVAALDHDVDFAGFTTEECVFQAVLEQFVDDERNGRRKVGGQLDVVALNGDGNGGLQRQHIIMKVIGQFREQNFQIDGVGIRAGQHFVGQADALDVAGDRPRKCLNVCIFRLRSFETDEADHSLQIVFDTVMDFPDKGFLIFQLFLQLADAGAVIADGLLERFLKRSGGTVFCDDPNGIGVGSGVGKFVGEGADDATVCIADGADGVANDETSLVNDADESSAGRALLQRTINCRFIFPQLDFPDDVSVIQVIVWVAILCDNERFAVACEYVDVSVAALQIPDKGQRV